MQSFELHDHVYHFSNIELKNIYLHFYDRGAGPNGENYGGPTLETRFGYYDWFIKWNYPLTESAILIYSENVPMYVISTVDFGQYSFTRDPYTGEHDYIPRKYYDKKEVMPEKQPGKPRYYDLPVSAPIRLLREGRPDNPYLPATPSPTEPPTPTPTLTDPTAPPTAIETPSPVGTSVPQPTLVWYLPPRPTPTPARPHELHTEPTIGEIPTPVETPEMTVAMTPEETPPQTPEVTHEVFLEADIGASSGMTVEEATPPEGANETV
jgi:hypothetical protein